MCDVGTASLALGGAQFAGSVLSAGEESAQAGRNNKAAIKNYIADEKYKNEVYAQDIAYFRDVLKYQRNEFQTQVDIVDKTQSAVKQDYIQQLRTLALRSVEEALSSTFQKRDVVRQGREMTATANVSAGERGIGGNTGSLIQKDVARQVGEARHGLDRQQHATQRQLQLEAQGLSASADTALATIRVQPYQPIQPPTPPSAGARPVMQNTSKIGSILSGSVGAISTGLSTYKALK